MNDETNLGTLEKFDEFAEFDEFAGPPERPCDKILKKKATRKRKSVAKKASKNNGSKRLILKELQKSAIDRESYSGDPALNWSTLKKFVDDPRAFQLYSDERSDAKDFGTLFHAAFLEPNRFAEKARTFDPPINPKTGESFGTTTKAYLEAFDAWKETIPPDAMICSKRDRETINESLVSFAIANPFVKGLFEGEYATELPLETVDKVNGIEIKGRLDYFSDEFGIVDVKTTNSPIVNWDGSDAFYWTARRFGYLFELAYYAKIVEQISGVLPPVSMLVFEVVKPYRVGVYKVSLKTIRESIRRIDEEFIPFWIARPTSKSIQFEY